MRIRRREAFVAGLAGGLAVSVGMTLARALGITPLNHEMLIGSLVVRRVGPVAWLVGLAIWMLCSGLIAMGYALFFDRVMRGASAAMGVFLGFVQLYIVGFLILAAEHAHPFVSPHGAIRNTAFLSGGGVNFTFLVVAVLMLLYGGIVGAWYEHGSEWVAGRVMHGVRRRRHA